MILPIYLYGHPVLRNVSKDITADYPELKKLVADMFETMYASEGVGLAAPQIGRNDRIVVIDADPLKETYPELAGRRLTLINPRVEVLDGEKKTCDEGCLSLPGLSEKVTRVEHIRVTWVDEDFQPREEEFSGFLSRIIQHEVDHLEGKVYIDHVTPIRKQLIKRKLTNIVEGKVAPEYPYRTTPRRRK